MLTRFRSKFTPLEKIGPSSSGANNGTFNSFTRLLLCHRLIELSLQSKVWISRFKIWYIGFLNENVCKFHTFLRGNENNSSQNRDLLFELRYLLLSCAQVLFVLLAACTELLLLPL